jgi:AP-1 complex subunit sigma 1/2
VPIARRTQRAPLQQQRRKKSLWETRFSGVDRAAGCCSGVGSLPGAGAAVVSMIHFVLLISRQGKVRLTKWYSPYSAKEKSRAVREVSAVVLSRQQKQCNFLEYKDKKIIYKRCALAPPLSGKYLAHSCSPDIYSLHALRRYASLYFLACVDDDDNELIVLETIHHFVEVLDRYFGNVCELDLIFNFHKVRARACFF